MGRVVELVAIAVLADSGSNGDVAELGTMQNAVGVVVAVDQEPTAL